ncbi:MAG: DNA primase [Anaerovoracaceae bacterium]|jgi:DNA primase
MVESNVIEEIKSRCNIVDIVGRVVHLKRAGSSYKGLCPFHNEKTPSFVVSEQKQIFTCFGCGATGDVIEFVKRYDNLDFNDALEKLAAECGVTIERSYRGSKRREELYEINRQAAIFFYRAMRSGPNPGLEYMRGRGLRKETLHDFGIGYADAGWNSLHDHLRGLGYSDERLLEAGLLSRSKGRCYDKFRDRVIFPIQNAAGRVIGFGGRTLQPDGIPKYLNSPETSVFRKKNNLYGLHLSGRAMRSEGCAILVEGYMDVIALYEAGIHQVAASLGTALTEQQAHLLKRYTDSVVLSYDADSAGRAAALRGIEVLHREGLRVRVLHVTDGKDPDEFVRKQGRQAFLDLIDEALPYADYKLADLAQRYHLDRLEERAEFLTEAARLLQQLEPVEADLYRQKIAAEFGVSEAALRAQMGRSVTASPPAGAPRRSRQKQRDRQLTAAERSMIQLLLTDASYLDKEPGVTGVFVSEAGKSILKALQSVYKKDSDFDLAELEQVLSEEEQEMVREIREEVVLTGDLDTICRDCIRKAELEQWKEEEELLIMRLSMADEEANREDIRTLTEQLIAVQKKIKSGGN